MTQPAMLELTDVVKEYRVGEPTGNLDSKTGASILELPAEVAESGNSVVMVTHDRGAVDYCDRVVTLGDGPDRRRRTHRGPAHRRRLTSTRAHSGASDHQRSISPRAPVPQ